MSFFFKLGDATTNYTAGIYSSPGLNTLADEYLAMYGLSHDARQKYLRSIKKVKPRAVDILLGSHPEYAISWANGNE
jgi:hypothetical protein